MTPSRTSWPRDQVPQTAKDLQDCLLAERLITLEGLAALPPAPHAEESAANLAARLVDAGLLTAYQASLLLAGKAHRLWFGDYLVHDSLGAGGMGEVLKAEHRRMKRIVALKVIATGAAQRADFIRRFQREVEVSARLIHSNIVTALDANEHEGIPYLVMEYVEGQDLNAVLKSRGALPVSLAADCIAQAACGLAYAHDSGIIHRDIKPGNLLLDAQQRVKILDLGLARLNLDDAAPEAELTASGQVMGSVDYMAPEQALDTHSADARSDIYSLGCTLYKLLTNRVPYDEASIIKKILAHRDEPAPDLAANCPDCPVEVVAIFERMTAKRPEDRFQTMHEVVQALKPWRSQAAGALELRAPSSSQAHATRRTHEPTVSYCHVKTDPDRAVSAAGGRSARVRLHWKRWLPLAVGAVMAAVALPWLLASMRDRETLPETLVAPDSIDSVRQALILDGQDDYVLLPKIDYDGESPITFEAWVTPSLGQRETEAALWGNAGWFLQISEWGWHHYRGQSAIKGPAIKGRRAHVAAVWDGTHVSLFVDGRLERAAEPTDAMDFRLPLTLGCIGKAQGTAREKFFPGKIEEMRLSATARYTEKFKPAERFESDVATLALYHCKEGHGDLLHDASGYDRHARIVGATWEHPVTPDPSARDEDPRRGLEFDGKKSHVVLPPSLKLPDDRPITIEAIVTPREGFRSGIVVISPEHVGGSIFAYNGAWVGRALPKNSKVYVESMTDHDVLQPGRRVHLACVWDLQYCYLYVDGQLAPKEPVLPFEANKLDTLLLGGGVTPEGERSWIFDGVIHQVRFSENVRYAASFTAPQQLMGDADTLALYRCDQQTSGRTLTDSSGHNHHGEIIDASWFQPSQD